MSDAEVASALRARHLCLLYQPQYQLLGGRLRGFEALARLSVGQDHDQEYGWIAPEHFIPVACAAGLMGALTLHLIEEACRALRAWRGRNPHAVFIAVNIESEDLADILFAPRVSRLLAQYRIRPGELELELVERRSIQLSDTCRANIRQLRGQGIRFALDDFGTGYSALSLLAELPFDVVKIDKAFLARVPRDPEACTLMTGVVQLCIALHKEVVVEGVESHAQLSWLESLPPHRVRVQGNALSFPLHEPQARAHLPLTGVPSSPMSMVTNASPTSVLDDAGLDPAAV
ncbi:EAL domain-containing protein [Xylophilus sp. GOD-11R]|uniref:EAL domain-containing protein n=1 Tax=Xylophilus sp. GOD-11R TaxID=3089814 RepID=UPI00298D20F6|nr:EAL domain-containing protein [Xylophilus sp. GOD-11R]WPB57001.1 EAL domain-containing protein [Xylophilus sp. GOD-11R]